MKKKLKENDSTTVQHSGDENHVEVKVRKKKRAETEPEAVEKKKRAETEPTEPEAVERKKKKKRTKCDEATEPEPVVEEPRQPKKRRIEEKSKTTDSSEPTVYVDGIPYDWSIEDIRKVFKACGSILDVRAPTYHDSGRLRGYAHIDFSTMEECIKAVALSGHKTGCGNRYLRVQAANEKKSQDQDEGSKVAKGSTLFLKNLPYDCSEDHIGDMFAGQCSQVRIATQYGRNKGFAYVDFANKKLAQSALSGGPYVLKGRKLLVCGDVTSSHKAGFHYRDEAYKSQYGPKKQQSLF